MSARNVLGAVALGRLAFALWMLVSPRDVGSRWVGEDGTSEGSGALLRAVAGREIAFALGSLEAVRSERDPAPWLAASVLVDGTDGVAVLAATSLPLKRRLLAASAAFGTMLANLFGLGLTDGD